MSEAWKRWEGQIVDGRFPLQQYLGGSEHSAVFLTERTDQEPRKVAIKLIPADPTSGEIELSHWKSAQQLFHPHLLRIFHVGRCHIEDVPLLYAVTECAEENLAQIIPARPLSGEETRDMLAPVLDALSCVHRQGFVHGRLKPANIMATGDKIKLSTDSLIRSTETAKLRKSTGYDSPEAGSGRLSSASDIWSLGITVVETLTQRIPVWERVGHDDPILPKSLPEPFYEIARNCLRRDPQARCTVADIAARLRTTEHAASAVAQPVPVSVPAPAVVAKAAAAAAAAPPVPVVPLAPSPVSTAPAIGIGPRSSEARRKPKQISSAPAPLVGSSWSRYAAPVVGVCILLALLVALPKLLYLMTRSSNTTVSSAQQASSQKEATSSSAKPSPAPASGKSGKSVGPRSAAGVKAASDKQPIAKPAPTPSAAPAATSSNSPASVGSAGGAAAPGEVLDQVLPDISQKARDTIQGKVRVSVKVSVDPSGSVTSASLDAPGPSQYFADKALQATRRWEFAPAKVGGRGVPTEWLILFHFSQTDTQVFPKQTSP